MNEYLNRIASKPELVSYVIDGIVASFNNIYVSYAKQNRDPYSYYLTGHCASFAYVLYKVFEGTARIMDSTVEGHVVVKIGEHVYDVRGCVDSEINIENYQDCPIEYFPYVELTMTKDDDYDKEIREDLIKIGKEAIGKLKEELVKSDSIEEGKIQL